MPDILELPIVIDRDVGLVVADPLKLQFGRCISYQMAAAKANAVHLRCICRSDPLFTTEETFDERNHHGPTEDGWLACGGDRGRCGIATISTDPPTLLYGKCMALGIVFRLELR